MTDQPLSRRDPTADDVFASEIESFEYDEADRTLYVYFAALPVPMAFFGIRPETVEAFRAAPDRKAYFLAKIRDINAPRS